MPNLFSSPDREIGNMLKHLKEILKLQTDLGKAYCKIMQETNADKFTEEIDIVHYESNKKYKLKILVEPVNP